ncbi:MAG: hypothetical protein J6D37_08660 [Clostridia bacterium]|nr:hypothetical protein [Clostridia bacterium]
MKGKRWFGVLVSGALAFSLCLPAPIADAAVADTVAYTVQYADAVSSKVLSYEGVYNDDWFSQNGEDGRIAKLSMAMSAEVYSSAEEMEKVLSSIGFTVVEQVNYDRVATSGDCDFVTYTIASREIGEDTLYGVFLRGTAGDMQWQSNFNIGEGEVHRGFDTAAQEVFAKLSEVIGSEKKEHNKVWITGHSRGGAVANLLGATVNEHAEFVTPEHTFVYNFAVPATTKQPVAYPNIFNYNYAGDVITALPLESWGFSRHGTTHTYDEALNEEANALFTSKTEVAFAGLGNVQEFSTNLSSWCPTQADYYKKDTTFGTNLAPVDIMTTYLVPYLIGAADFTAADLIGDLGYYAITHRDMIYTIMYFVENQAAIVQGHSQINYLTYTDAMYPHVHEFDDYVSNGDATCTEDGTKTAHCYDGASDTVVDEGSALGHNFSYDHTSEEGYLIEVCSRCGESRIVGKDISYAQLTIETPEKGFEYLGKPVTPSFTVVFQGETLEENVDYTVSFTDNDKAGTASLVIKGLGDFTGRKEAFFEIAAHEHVFQYVYQNDATCTEDGTEKAVCYCGEVSTRTKESTKLGHNYVLAADQPDERYELHSCSRCGDSYSFKVIDFAEVEIAIERDVSSYDSSCFTLVWEGETLVLGEDYELTYTAEPGEDSVRFVYKIVGIHGEMSGFVGQIEGEREVPYPPDPYAWVIWVAAAGAGVIGIGAIGAGVVLGRKRRF